MLTLFLYYSGSECCCCSQARQTYIWDYWMKTLSSSAASSGRHIFTTLPLNTGCSPHSWGRPQPRPVGPGALPRLQRAQEASQWLASRPPGSPFSAGCFWRSCQREPCWGSFIRRASAVRGPVTAQEGRNVEFIWPMGDGGNMWEWVRGPEKTEQWEINNFYSCLVFEHNHARLNGSFPPNSVDPWHLLLTSASFPLSIFLLLWENIWLYNESTFKIHSDFVIVSCNPQISLQLTYWCFWTQLWR